MTIKKTIGRKIAKFRYQKGMSQEDLAGEAEINRSFLSNIENGQANFTIDMLVKISKALSIKPKDVFD